jgi:hypothetical protein
MAAQSVGVHHDQDEGSKTENSLHLPRRYRTPDGESIVEHVAGIEDYQVALATYRE